MEGIFLHFLIFQLAWQQMIIFQANLLKTWLQRKQLAIFYIYSLKYSRVGGSMGQLDALNEADLSMIMTV